MADLRDHRMAWVLFGAVALRLTDTGREDGRGSAEQTQQE